MLSSIPSTVIEVCSSVSEPTYVYDVSDLRRSASLICRAFEEVGGQVLFATMANPHPEILAAVAALGVGACVNSVGHLRAALRAGIAREKIQFTSSALSFADLVEIASNAIQCNIDSTRQAVMLSEIVTSGMTCGARVNTRLLLGESIGPYDRLGIDPGEIGALHSFVRSRRGRLNGAHIYVGTNFQSYQEMLPPLDRFFDLVSTMPDLAYVNLGGGIGIDYSRCHQFDISGYARAVGERVFALRDRLGRPIELFVEPGRAMVASAGYFTCRVTDIKSLRGQIIVGVNASVAQFPRPWHHPETTHQVHSANANGRPLEIGDAFDAIIAGRTTYSKDVLARARLPSTLEVGDTLIFTDAGAYCDSMASTFLGQPSTESRFIN